MLSVTQPIRYELCLGRDAHDVINRADVSLM